MLVGLTGVIVEVGDAVGVLVAGKGEGLVVLAPHADTKTRANHQPLIFTGIVPLYTERQLVTCEPSVRVCS